MSIASAAVTRTCDLPRPAITLDNEVSTGKITISWDSVYGAEKYEVWRKEGENGTWSRITTTTKTSVVNTKVDPGVTYYYRVRALHSNTDANSAYSAVVNATCKLPQPVLTVDNVASTGKIQLNWTAVEGAEKYEIWHYHGELTYGGWEGDITSQFSLLTTTTKTSAVPTGLVMDEAPHQFKIRAVCENTAGNSAYSAIQSGYVHLSQPVVKISNISSTGQIKLTWAEVPSADEYYIYRSTSKTGYYENIAYIWWQEFNGSYTDTSAEPGQLYYYKVQAASAGIGSSWSDVVSRTCDLPRPTLTVSNVASTGKVKLSWTAVEGAVKYQIYRSLDNVAWEHLAYSTGTSATNKGTDAGVTYYYKVRAIHSNTDANSAYSSVKSRMCDLPRPVVTLSNVESSGKIKISWNAVEGAVKYQVYRSTEKSSGYSLLTTTTGTSVTNTSVEPGVTYYYKVIAVAKNTSANSAYSAVTSRTCDLARTTITLSNVESTGKIKISWNAVEGAVKYQVYRSTSENGTYSLLTTTTGTSVTNTSAEPGVTYYYKVRAIASNSAANGAYSAIKSWICDLPRPTITVSNVASTGKIKISWNAVAGAVKYQVYRSTSETGTYSLLTTTTGTSVTNTSVEMGVTYYYKVRAVAEITSANSAYSSVKSRIADLAQPTITVSNVTSTGKIKISWKAVTGAEKYEVWRKGYWDEKFTRVKTTTSTSYIDTGAGLDMEGYEYKVRAIHSNTNANSAYSATKRGYTRLALPVVTASNVASTGQIKLTWKEVPNADEYYIYRATSKTGTYENIAYVWWQEFNGSYTDTSAEPGKLYYYKVEASSAGIGGTASQAVSRTADLPRPTVTVSNVESSGKIKISWNPIGGAAKYEVWRSLDNTTWSRISTTTKTSLTNTSTEAGTKYYYKVRAVHENTSANSAYSSVKSRIADLAQPTITVSNVASTGKIKISWKAVEGATKYEVWRATDEWGTFTRISTTTNLSVTNNSASVNDQYWYKVRAICANTDGNSAYSAVKSAWCVPAQPKVTISNDAVTGTILLSWKSVEGAWDYRVLRSTSKSSGYKEFCWENATDIGDRGVVPGTTYYYRVYANGEVQGAYTQVSRTADLPRPSLTVTLSSGKPKLSWTAVDGAVKYEVYRSTDNATWSRISTTTKTTLTNTSVVAGTKYYYKVRAIAENTDANSAYSLVKSTTAK